jgi:hypothetical protein
MKTYEELLEENEKLKSEIKETYEALYPAGLVTADGKEIATSLLERAKMAVMIINSEADYADEAAKERDEIQEAIAWYIRCEERWIDSEDYANKIEKLTVEEIYEMYPRSK